MISNKVLKIVVVFSLFIVCFAEMSFAKTPEDLVQQTEQIMQSIRNNQIPMAKAQVARFYEPEYRAFLKETFGDDLGSAYARDFNELVPSLADFTETMTKRFQMEAGGTYTGIKCFKIDNPSDSPKWIWRQEQAFLMKNMKKPVSLYEIVFYASGEREWYRPIANFVIINGSFKLIGMPKRATCGLN
ncbi:MAG: hypothetical protein ACD_39C00918G0002 [uncultured bacterium]|nr:MAG: hypothetical protein ACD_39C00918G0002 [uncultured bacterium]